MIVWDGQLETGIAAVDADHKRMIDFINLIEKANKANLDRLANRELLGHLLFVIHKHFTREEDIMRASSYHNINQHIDAHKVLIDTMNMMVADYEKRGAIIYILDYIAGYFKIHFKEHDNILAEFLKPNPLSKSAKGLGFSEGRFGNAPYQSVTQRPTVPSHRSR